MDHFIFLFKGKKNIPKWWEIKKWTSSLPYFSFLFFPSRGLFQFRLACFKIHIWAAIPRDCHPQGHISVTSSRAVQESFICFSLSRRRPDTHTSPPVPEKPNAAECIFRGCRTWNETNALSCGYRGNKDCQLLYHELGTVQSVPAYCLKQYFSQFSEQGDCLLLLCACR